MNFRHFLKHDFKDSYDNLTYYFNAKLRSNNYSGGERAAFPAIGYKTVFEDNFDGPLNRKEWRVGQEWGDFHPDDLGRYTGDEEFSYTKDGCLILDIKNKPKRFIKRELPKWRQAEHLPPVFTIPNGSGLVKTFQSWQYGWFEAWIKLPKGSPYWPAFWLSGAHSWPPEIDILEGYSVYGERYDSKNWWGKLIPNQKIQPNLHYGSDETGTKTMYGAWDIPVADCTERFVQYACLWEKDRIEIYYDGIIVFKCTDPEILKWFNKENAQQSIILNHGSHKGYLDIIPNESSMEIKSVKVLQKQ